jgi:hypothetical protein
VRNSQFKEWQPQLPVCQWSFFALTVCTLLAGGCSLGPVNTPAFSDESHVRRIDPNNEPFTVREFQRTDPNTGRSQTVRRIRWKPADVSFDSGGERSFTIGYDPLQFWLTRRVLVPIELSGRCGESAIVDTGFSGYVYMNDLMIESCDLAVLPLQTNHETGSPVGLCDIPALKLGPMTIAHPPCMYEQMQWQFKVLGIPLYRHKIVLLGLDFTRLFSYVLFDNTRHELVFSRHDPFEPGAASDWLRLPFTLDRIEDNLRMMVSLPLGNGKVNVEFDTGGAKPGLTLRQTAWQRAAPSLQARSNGTGRCESYQYGSLPCRKYIVSRLQAGPIEVENAAVDVLPDTSPLMRHVDGILSLDYFSDTTVVIDFKKDLIWIKQR